MANYQLKNVWSFGQQPPGSVASKINDPVPITGYNKTYLKPSQPDQYRRVMHSRSGTMTVDPNSYDSFGNAASISKPSVGKTFNLTTMNTAFPSLEYRRPVPRIGNIGEEMTDLETSSEAVDKLEPTGQIITILQLKTRLEEFQKSAAPQNIKDQANMLMQEVIKIELASKNREVNMTEQNALNIIDSKLNDLITSGGLPPSSLTPPLPSGPSVNDTITKMMTSGNMDEINKMIGRLAYTDTNININDIFNKINVIDMNDKTNVMNYIKTEVSKKISNFVNIETDLNEFKKLLGLDNINFNVRDIRGILQPYFDKKQMYNGDQETVDLLKYKNPRINATDINDIISFKGICNVI